MRRSELFGVIKIVWSMLTNVPGFMSNDTCESVSFRDWHRLAGR